MDRFRLLAESLPLIVWTANPNGEVDYQTRAVLAYTGCTPEQLAGEKWFDVIHPEDRAHTGAAWMASIETGDPYEVEFRIRRHDGAYRWFFTRAVPVRDDDGAITKWYGSSTDIHDVRETASRVKEQAELIERARDAILVRELDHTIVYWNSGAERLYGWKREEAVGRTIGEILHDDPEEFEAATLRVLEKGEWVGEIQHRCRDGSKVTVDGSWSLIRDEEGDPKRILAIHTDVTERKKILAQFLRAQRMESIGTLAGGIAHDLNNVLTPILLSTQLLRQDLKGTEAEEILGTIESSAERGAAMVRQVLAFARGVEGAQISVDLPRIVSDLGRVVRDTFPKNITFKNEIGEGRFQLIGDPTQIHQVLLNLFVNARDAMPGGGTLTVSAKNVVLDEAYAVVGGEGAPGAYVRISVGDSGEGMSEEVVQRIFDPFFTTKPVGEGTGLGLSTVQAIVKSHGGFVNVYSEPGNGTIFRVYLPAAGIDAQGADGGESREPPRGHGELVLVVDDESSVREVTRQTLEAFGYRVLTATDGADAVAIFARNIEGIDLVLTDIMMPIMDGSAAIRALLRMNPKARIIAASGLGASGGVAQAVDAGVRHFLPKPYSAASLLEKVREVLDVG